MRFILSREIMCGPNAFLRCTFLFKLQNIDKYLEQRNLFSAKYKFVALLRSLSTSLRKLPIISSTLDYSKR